jgi:multidrug efflux pump subunit AcrA (membrane-fusion protein)
LASDQATIDSDRASVATAKADLAQATLRSPINGKVVATTVSKGAQVDGTSSSTSPALKVVGSKQSKVTIDVTAAQVRGLKTGMAAQVTPDGASKALAGPIMSIGQATTDSSTGDTTYPVTITLTSRPTGLVSGADAQVSLVLSHLTGVVVVPTSAVHTSGTRVYVETEVAGKLTRRTVTVGAVGADVTQIKSGVTVGSRVILADLNAAVPSSSTNLLNNNTGGTGLSGRTFSRTGGTSGSGFTGPPPGFTQGG